MARRLSIRPDIVQSTRAGQGRAGANKRTHVGYTGRHIEQVPYIYLVYISYIYIGVCALVLGRLRRLIADRISVNKRNKHFRAGMSSDLRAFPHRCTAAAAAAPAPGNRSMGRRCRRRVTLLPCHPVSNRRDIFGATPAACQNCTNP